MSSRLLNIIFTSLYRISAVHQHYDAIHACMHFIIPSSITIPLPLPYLLLHASYISQFNITILSSYYYLIMINMLIISYPCDAVIPSSFPSVDALICSLLLHVPSSSSSIMSLQYGWGGSHSTYQYQSTKQAVESRGHYTSFGGTVEVPKSGIIKNMALFIFFIMIIIFLCCVCLACCRSCHVQEMQEQHWWRRCTRALVR